MDFCRFASELQNTTEFGLYFKSIYGRSNLSLISTFAIDSSPKSWRQVYRFNVAAGKFIQINKLIAN